MQLRILHLSLAHACHYYPKLSFPLLLNKAGITDRIIGLFATMISGWFSEIWSDKIDARKGNNLNSLLAVSPQH